jgi:tRNA(Ile)-lysidine synthase
VSTSPDRALDLALSALSPAPAGLLVALSGGLDSSALLSLTAPWALAHGVPLRAAHVDHGMRASSVEDARWCATLCARLGVPLDTVTLSPPPHSQSHARARRSGHLAMLALAHGADTILTAHHADDVLETALINLTRGASSGGMSSLARPTAPLQVAPDALGLRWCRPLLACSRDALERYWGEREHATDPTNETDAYRRNRVRHHALPALLDEPGAREGALATVANLADEARALEARAAALADRTWRRQTPLRVEVDLDALDRCDPHPAERAALWRALTRALPSTRGWSRLHLDALTEMSRRGGPAAFDLPGARAERAGAVMVVEASPTRGATVDRVAVEVPLDTSRAGRLRWFGGTLSWVPGEPPPGRSGPLEASLPAGPADAITLRGVRPGDRVCVGRGERPAKEIARAARVPSRDRWRAPLVCVSGEPVWLAGAHTPAPPGAPGAPRVWMLWSPPEVGK